MVYLVQLIGRNGKPSDGRHSAARKKIILLNENMSYTIQESISNKSEKEDMLSHGRKISFAPKLFLIVKSKSAVCKPSSQYF